MGAPRRAARGLVVHWERQPATITSPSEERPVPSPLIPSPDMSAARRPRRRALAAAALLIGLLGLAA